MSIIKELLTYSFFNLCWIFLKYYPCLLNVVFFILPGEKYSHCQGKKGQGNQQPHRAFEELNGSQRMETTKKSQKSETKKLKKLVAQQYLYNELVSAIMLDSSDKNILVLKAKSKLTCKRLRHLCNCKLSRSFC